MIDNDIVAMNSCCLVSYLQVADLSSFSWEFRKLRLQCKLSQGMSVIMAGDKPFVSFVQVRIIFSYVICKVCLSNQNIIHRSPAVNEDFHDSF